MISLPRRNEANEAHSFYAEGNKKTRVQEKGTTSKKIPHAGIVSPSEFAINLKVAKALGLTIPAEVLFRADKVIK